MKRILFILLSLTIVFATTAQTTNVNILKGEGRNCGTMIYLEQQKKDNPNLAKQIELNEIKIQNWIKSNASEKLSNIISIPVVVHVVYNNNNENISDQQIQSQIDILNEDFRRQNADAVNTPAAFLPVAADSEIEFCLATEDPNGNTTTGITRTSTSQTSFSTNNGVKYSSSGGINAWDPLSYLNIWVCDLSGGLLGYAQFPGGTVSSDGVVCDYAYFGNIGTATAPYDLGRTATHEVGHWLNLRHIWGDSNCGNDFCNDTPEHSGSNYGCPSFPSTSNCSGNGTSGDMFMNYMDYTDDACMNIFTQDQKTRMIAAINNFRSGLLTSNGCSNADYGCTDQSAYNYSSVAIIDDGSCCYIAGCTDATAINYSASACFDDGSCQQPILGCTNPLAINYDPNANTTTAYGGELDYNFGSGGWFNGDQHLNFDATKECVIKSAKIYSEASNTITFELRNSGGIVLDDTTLTVASGQQTLNLNFEVPIGNDMQLGVAQGALQTYGLYRNNSGASYPYDIAGAINITSSSASSAPFVYYYFYYDIEVETPCLGSVSASWDCDGQGNCVDPGNGTGQYNSLAACQTSCVVPSWDCDGQGNCIDPGNGTGQYNSLAACQTSCVVPSWDCDGQGNCIDPGNGTGQYNSLAACQTSCVVPSWDCDGQGNCIDPGNGTGQYNSLAACQTSCVVPSWDCDGQGNCIDPGNGTGQYNSLAACQTSCVVPSWDCDGQGNCIDPGNGTGQYNSLAACQTSCVVPSWDCDGQGNCVDPGNGQGVYSTLLDCEIECVNVSVYDNGINNFKLFPNPTQGMINIQFTHTQVSNLELNIFNSVGESVLKEVKRNHTGEYITAINLEKYSKSVYFIEIKTDYGIMYKKIILQ